MKAIIEVDIPDFQIGQEVSIYFKDTMMIKGVVKESSDDLISREELLKEIDTWDKFGVDDTNSLFRLDNLSLPHYVPYIHYDDVIKCIKGMPPTKPQEPKTGHWIETDSTGFEFHRVYKCSECGNTEIEYPEGIRGHFRYCPNCGCRMESEG